MSHEVRLRDVREADLPILFEHQADPVAARMASFLSRDAEAFAKHWKKILRDGTVTKKTILFDGGVAGNIVCFMQSGDRLVGYWIGREYWGKGVATSALAQFLTHVTARPLRAFVAKDNVASIRVLEKCGFTRCAEGTVPAAPGAVDELMFELEQGAPAADQRDARIASARRMPSS